MPGHRGATQIPKAQHFYEALWLKIGLYGRFALIGFAVLLVVLLLVMLLRRLGRAGRRAVLVGVTIVCLIGTVSLGFWSVRLPEPGGSYFVLWHQIVRVGAALSSTGLVLALIFLALPWVLNRLENWRL